MAPVLRELAQRVKDHVPGLADRLTLGDSAGHLRNVGGESAFFRRLEHDGQFAVHSHIMRTLCRKPPVRLANRSKPPPKLVEDWVTGGCA